MEVLGSSPVQNKEKVELGSLTQSRPRPGKHVFSHLWTFEPQRHAESGVRCTTCGYDGEKINDKQQLRDISLFRRWPIEGNPGITDDKIQMEKVLGTSPV